MKMRVSAVLLLLSSLILTSSIAFAGRGLQAGDLVAPINEDHLYYVDEVVGEQVKVRKVDTDSWFKESDKDVAQFLGNDQADVQLKDLRRMTLSFTPDNHLPILQEANEAECEQLGLGQVLMQDQVAPPAATQDQAQANEGCGCACLSLKKIFGRRNH